MTSAAQAAQALRPLAGEFAFALFAAGITATGRLAVPVLASSAAYAVAEAFGWPEGLKRHWREAKGFYAIIGAATIVDTGLDFTPVDPMKALYWSAVVNGVVAVPIMFAMMLLAGKPEVMGSLPVRRKTRAFGWDAGVLTSAAVLMMGWDLFRCAAPCETGSSWHVACTCNAMADDRSAAASPTASRAKASPRSRAAAHAPESAAPWDREAWTSRLSLLLESTGEGIFGVDNDGRCTFMNRAASEMLGYGTEMVLGRNMHELIHHTHGDGRHYPQAECPIFNAFRLGLPCRIDSEVLWRADGSAFPAEYSSHPILDDGVVQGAVMTLVDVTERKRGEALLREAHEQLERRVDERTSELSRALGQMRELSAHLESVREDERTRIAREIHDELGSLLVALKMDVNWLEARVGDRADLAGKCHGMGRM